MRREEKDNNSSAGDPKQLWYRYGGKQMGYVSNDGTLDTSYVTSIANRTAASAGNGAFFNGATTGTAFADFDVATDQVNSYHQGSGAGTYTVQQGDTLNSIAANLWGDSSLWYKLAAVNGLAAGAPLTEGTALTIPAGVIRDTNSASTFRPYDPGEIIGNVNPTTAPIVSPGPATP